VRRAAVQWVRNGRRADDGQTAGRRTQRCEELSGKGNALSNGVQADAIDAGPRRVARERGGSSMPNPALHLIAAAGVRRRRTIPRLRQLRASLVRKS
jgi:hypothetical protein